MDRFSPLTIDHHTLANRLVVPPMASQTATEEGFATDSSFRHYANLAQSEAGLVMVEYSYVHRSGRSEPNQLSAAEDSYTEGLAKICATIHKSGAKAGLQLTHCGGKGVPEYCGDLMGPSGITVPAYDRHLTQPRKMSLNDVELWRDSFVDAAIRAEQAGFDLVELHCAHGYGLNQFLSPLTNQRNDQYGGSQANRTRLVVEIVERIKQQTALTVMVRIAGQDLYPKGLTQEQVLESSQMLIDVGVSVLNVSSGIGGWNRPKERRGEGYLVSESRFIKSAGLNAAVIGVGGIETGAYIDRCLADGSFDLAAVGRAILKGPADFAQQQMCTHKKTQCCV